MLELWFVSYVSNLIPALRQSNAARLPTRAGTIWGPASSSGALRCDSAGCFLRPKEGQVKSSPFRILGAPGTELLAVTAIPPLWEGCVLL